MIAISGTLYSLTLLCYAPWFRTGASNTAWFQTRNTVLPRQKHLATPFHSKKRKACCTGNAKRVITVVCCIYWLKTSS